jgi:cytochrome c oxidase subunit 2
MRDELNTRSDLRKMLAIGAIASITGIALALLIDWFPPQASEEAKDIDTLWDVLLIVSVPIFVLCQTVVLYSVWRFRMRPGEEEDDGPPIHGNTRLEVVWTAVPAIILVALCSYAYVVLRDIESAPAGQRDMDVRVVGEQFTWTFYYPGEGGKGKEVASNQLYLPLGRGVKFKVESKDVLHDFWVPAFRQKIDAVPGITTSIRITTRRLGTFPVICAELCGLGHSVMRQSAHVVKPDEFEKWLADKRGAGGAAGGGGGTAGGGGEAAAPDGKAIFTGDAGCKGCHTLSDAGANATVGPDLDKVLKGKDADFMKTSITDPGAFVEKGFPDGVMPPDYGQTLKPEEIDALTDYLVKVAGK